MAQRRAHGAAAKNGTLVVHEPVPFDELPQADPQAAPSGPLNRRQNGTVADKTSALALAEVSKLKRALRTRILRSLGLAQLGADHAFYAYEFAGEEFADGYIASLESSFDGICGEGPASIVKTAGMQLAISRFMYDKGKLVGDAKLLGQGSQIANDSRVNVGAAYELQSREAGARAKARPVNVHEQVFGKGAK